MEEQPYLLETSRYAEQGLWVKRISLCIVLGGITLTWVTISSDLSVWRFALPIVVMMVIIAVPFDEVAITSTHLIHTRRSVFGFFTRLTKYQLLALTSVELYGNYNSNIEAMQTFAPGSYQMQMNSLQINYKNGNVRSFNTYIYRADLLPIVEKANEIVQAGIHLQQKGLP